MGSFAQPVNSKYGRKANEHKKEHEVPRRGKLTNVYTDIFGTTCVQEIMPLEQWERSVPCNFPFPVHSSNFRETYCTSESHVGFSAFSHLYILSWGTVHMCV